MKGIILDSYVDFVENKFGIQKLNKIEEDLRSPIDYYTLKTYGDEEFYKLIDVSEVVLQLSKEKIQYQFGEFFFEVLIENYGHHFHKSNLIDFLIYLEDYIHPEVIETIEESEPPRFLLEEKENGFKLTYSSKRKMGDFAFGLLMRCNTFFENTYEIEKISSEGINTVFHIYKK